jgi:hypothetical protein
MDPALLIDLLFLKLANEFRGGKPVSAFSAAKTAELLKRVQSSDGALAQWVAQSAVSTDIALRKFALLALFDTLCIEDEDALLAKFPDAAEHDKVRGWREKMMVPPVAKQQEPPLADPLPEQRIRPLIRSAFRRRLVFFHSPT